MAGALGALSWYLTQGPLGRPLPQLAVNLLAIAAVAWLGVEVLYEQEHLIAAMGHFTMALQVLMLYARKTNRDYALLLVLSLLLMVGASVLSVSMLYGLALAAYCVVALLTVLVFHLKIVRDEADEQNRKAVPPTTEPLRLASPIGRGYRWQFRAIAAVIGLVCGSAATAVFVAMPRSGEQRFGQELAGPMSQTQTGFRSQVDLDHGAPQVANKEPVLNLSVSSDGFNLGGENAVYLLRGAALDEYTPRTRTWSRSADVASLDQAVSVSSDRAVTLIDAGGGPTYEAQVTLRQSVDRALFNLQPMTTLATDAIPQVTFNPLDHELHADTPLGGAILYAFKWNQIPSDATLDDAARRYPLLDPRFRDYAESNYARGWSVGTGRLRRYTQSILTRAGLERDVDALYTDQDGRIARTLQDHLRNPPFKYALTNPLRGEGERDPILAFLFDHKEGHCELYASALIAMTRSIGMQSRMVTGYQAGEYNPLGGYYTVRQSHAHAWAEVATAPGRWITVDATPSDEVRDEHDFGRGSFTLFRELYEHLEYHWIKTVVAYDQRTRAAVLSEMQNTVVEVTRDRESWFGAAVRYVQDLPRQWRLDTIGHTLAGGILIAIGVALLSLVRTLLLRRRRMKALQLMALPASQRRRLSRQLRFYLTMLEMLDRHGYARPEWQSPFGYATELAEAHPLRFGPVVALTELFYEVRFGHRPVDPERRQRIRAHLKALETALANK